MNETRIFSKNNSTSEDAFITAVPSNQLSPVLISLQHEGKRWESLRDRMTTSLKLRDKSVVTDGGVETWSKDEVFMRFLLDRLEKDLEEEKVGTLQDSTPPSVVEASRMQVRILAGDGGACTICTIASPQPQKSKCSADRSVGRMSTRSSRQADKSLRVDRDANPVKSNSSSNPTSVGFQKRDCGRARTTAKTGSAKADDKIPSSAGSPGENDAGKDTGDGKPEATDSTSGQRIRKEGEDCGPECPGDKTSETSREGVLVSRLSRPENQTWTGSSSDKLAAGIEKDPASSKKKSSEGDDQDDPDERATMGKGSLKTKRGKGRPRVELDEEEREALEFNKRLKEIQQRDLPKMFSCRSCGQQFQETDDLRMHTITAHLPISIPANSDTANEANGEICFTHIEIDLGLYQQVNEVDIRELAVELRRCPECSEYVEDMKTHVETHMVKNYICEACGKGFASSKQFKMHSVYHENDRAGVLPYSCDLCGKKFRTAPSLSIHRPLHNKARNYVCQQCGKTFKINVRLQKHLVTHAKVKPHLCSFCGRRFAQKCNMKRHQRTHTGEKPYACSHCNQAFNHNISLKNHLKKEHSIEQEDRAPKTVEVIDNFPAGRMPSKRVKLK